MEGGLTAILDTVEQGRGEQREKYDCCHDDGQSGAKQPPQLCLQGGHLARGNGHVQRVVRGTQLVPVTSTYTT